MAPSTRKPTSIRRLEIAEAALRVIGERGATALTTARLARELELTPGALFRHFASMDEILGAVVDLAIERVESSFPSQDLPPLERVRALLLRRIDLIGREPGLAWLLLSDQVYLCVPGEAVTRLRGLVQRSRTFLLQALSEGVERGELRGDLAPTTLLPILSGTVHALSASRGVHSPASTTAGANPAQVIESLLGLLATTSPASPSPRTE
jgi:AcrR family transcriptional regulator